MIEFLQVYVRYWDEWWPQLLEAAQFTIWLTVFGFLLAVCLGVLLAVGKLSRNVLIRRFSTAYIEFTRGIPTLALLFLLYFALPQIGIVLDEFVVGFIGLGMIAGGYIAEIFRAGIQAMHKGQREAALSVGMTPVVAFRYIILPQATRIVLPPLVNMLIVVLKESSVCALISAPELTLRAKDLATYTFLPMNVYLLVGLIYLALAWPLSLAARTLERRLRRSLRA